MPLARPPRKGTKFVQVIKTEEKGSDVNIAVNLLHDGYQGKYDLAVLVTNDSDLLSAIQIVQNALGLKVGILNPQKHPSKVLEKEALFILSRIHIKTHLMNFLRKWNKNANK